MGCDGLAVASVDPAPGDDERAQPSTRRYSGAAAAKYDWQVTVQNDTIHGDGTPTAGSPPCFVYELVPTVVLGFGTDESATSTRCEF
jgi:hypothetical protein